jgi:hypothetical protein
MKINICTIDTNDAPGRQVIYWDTDDKMLHSSADPDAETGYRAETLEEAQEIAHSLWNYPGSPWHLEWAEDEMDNQKAVDAYIGALGAMQDDVDAIQEYINNGAYEEVGPDEINWGHVGRLNSIEYRLQEIVSELYPERDEP